MSVAALSPSRQAAVARPKQTVRPRQADPAPQTASAQAQAPGLFDGLFEGVSNFFSGLFGQGQDDRVHDGEHSVHEYQPTDDSPAERAQVASARRRPTVLFVNGAGSDMESSRGGAELVSRMLGRDVELIHNATDIQKFSGGPLSDLANAISGIAGGAADVNQVTADHYGLGHNPAVGAVKDELARRLAAGETVDIVGHSQGNNIIARATRELYEEHPELHDRMGNLRVLNMAGPTRREDYAPGLVYDHAELGGDFVPRHLGEGMGPEAALLRPLTYPLVANPVGIALGFLTQNNHDHDPDQILAFGPNLERVNRLFRVA